MKMSESDGDHRAAPKRFFRNVLFVLMLGPVWCVATCLAKAEAAPSSCVTLPKSRLEAGNASDAVVSAPVGESPQEPGESTSAEAPRGGSVAGALRVLVTDSEGRPAAGRSVKLFAIRRSAYFDFETAMTGPDGIAWLKDPARQLRYSFDRGARVVAVLADCLAPAPMAIVEVDQGAEPLHLRVPPPARFEVALDEGMFLSRLADLRVVVREQSSESAGFEEQGKSDVGISRDVESRIGGVASIAADAAAIWKNVALNRTYVVEIEANDVCLARRTGVKGPDRAGDDVSIRIGESDVLENWFGIEVADPNGVPIVGQTFDLKSAGPWTKRCTVKTDCRGRAAVKRPWRSESPPHQTERPFRTGEGEAHTPKAKFQIRQRLFESRRIEFDEPTGVGAFVKLRFSDVPERLLLSGTIFTADRKRRGARSFRAIACDGVESPSAAGAAGHCDCGLSQGIDLKTNTYGRFYIRSRCDHRRIILSLEHPNEHFEVIYSDLPLEDVAIRVVEWTYASGHVVVDKEFEASAPKIEVVIRERSATGKITERESGAISKRDGRWEWRGRLRAGMHSTIVLRLVVTKEEIAATSEVVPHEGEMTIEAIDLRGRIP